MKILVTEGNPQGSKLAYQIIRDVNDNGGKVFGFATGIAPEETYRLLRESDVDFSDKISVNLDEYIGLADDHVQSYHYFMNKHLFNAKPFKKSYLPDGLGDPEKVTKDYDKILEENPIDLQILGLGNDGHIAFNEPGTPFDSKTHVSYLDESTIEFNSQLFDSKDEVPRSAFTMGISSIMSAKKIILLAFYESKAQAIHDMVLGPITEDLPASILQKHPDTTLILSRKSAKLLPDDMVTFVSDDEIEI
ncbi:MAG: glucosamine-6-phosphate deaminase [Peptoniphilaceae bacterium]|nr:glucosamine-6-phosphate deaminase [Peptoniphilaceae bacterium]MDD7382803.1 glucosamine-6-phosphate deaminase [Peptoniphilaceae bacterium]MDY3737961.1 glucosamine-6-phosphate deaminase [Peptoniphilaceae bacterium]